jgi:hypothetical protein
MPHQVHRVLPHTVPTANEPVCPAQRSLVSNFAFRHLSCKLLMSRQYPFFSLEFSYWRLWFLKSVALILFSFVLIVLAASVSSSSSRAADSSALQEHHLRLYHTHTGEHITSFTAAGIAILQRRKRSSIISYATIEQAP